MKDRLIVGKDGVSKGEITRKKAKISPVYDQLQLIKVNAQTATTSESNISSPSKATIAGGMFDVAAISRVVMETEAANSNNANQPTVPVYDNYKPVTPGPSVVGSGTATPSVAVPVYSGYAPVVAGAAVGVAAAAYKPISITPAGSYRGNVPVYDHYKPITPGASTTASGATTPPVAAANVASQGQEEKQNDEILLSDQDFFNIIDFGYSNCTTRDHPEQLSPLEPIIHYFNQSYNWIEYERITEAPTIQKSDMYATVVTVKELEKEPVFDANGDLVVDENVDKSGSSMRIEQRTTKPIMPWKAPVDKYGRLMSNGLEKVDVPKGRPRTPQKLEDKEAEERLKQERQASIKAIADGRSQPDSTLDKSRLSKGNDKASNRIAKYNAAVAASQTKPRVLLWSGLGFDRSVAVAVAYLVRRWNISIEQSLRLIKRHRPGVQISSLHMRALQRWQQVYLSGNFICVDCLIKSGGYDVNNPDKHSNPAVVVNDIISNNTGLHISKLDRNADAALIRQLGMTAGGSGALGGGGSSAAIAGGITNGSVIGGLKAHPEVETATKKVDFIIPSLSPDRPDKWEGNPLHSAPKAVDMLDKRSDRLNWIENVYKKLELEAASHYDSSHAVHADTHIYTVLGTPRVYLHAVRTEAYQLPLISVNAGAHGYKWSDNGDFNQYQAQAAEVEDPTHMIFRKIDVLNLCDISLPGRNLTDFDLTILMEALLNIHIVAQIRTLELQNNNIGDLGAESISTAFVVPTACFDEDINLMYLNLDCNWIGPSGATHLATFLRSNISLITLNIANNRIGDEGGAAIIGVLTMEDPEYVDVDTALMSQAQNLARHQRQHGVQPPSSRKRPKQTTVGMLAAVKLSGNMSVAEHSTRQESTASNGGFASVSGGGGGGDDAPFRFALGNNALGNSAGCFSSSKPNKSEPGVDADESKYYFGADIDSDTTDAIMSTAVQLTKNVNKIIELEPSLYNYTMTDLNISNNDLNTETAEALIEALKTNQTLTSLSMEATRDFSTRNWKYIYNGLRLYNQSIQKFSICDSVITPKCFLYFAKIFSSKINTISDYNLSRCNLTPNHMKLLATTIDSSLLESPAIKKLDLSYNKDVKNDGIVYVALSICGGGAEPKKKSKKLLDFQHEAEFSVHKRQQSALNLNEDGTEAPVQMSALRIHGENESSNVPFSQDMHMLSGSTVEGPSIAAATGVATGGSYRSETATFVKRKPLTSAAQEAEDQKFLDVENTEYYTRDNQISHGYIHHTAHLSKLKCNLVHLDLSCTGVVYFSPKQCVKKRNEDAINHSTRTTTGSCTAWGKPFAAPNLHGSSGVTSASALYSFGILIYVLQKYCPQLIYLDVSHNNLNNAFVIRKKNADGPLSVSGSLDGGVAGSSVATQYTKYGENENQAAVTAAKSAMERESRAFRDDESEREDSPYLDPENSEEAHEAYNANITENLMKMSLEVLKCEDCKLTPQSVNSLLMQLESTEKLPVDETQVESVGLFNRFRTEMDELKEKSNDKNMVFLTNNESGDSSTIATCMGAEDEIEKEFTQLSSTLQALYLGKNNIGEAVVDALIVILQSNVNIQILDLSWNQITSACMAKACSVLQVCMILLW